MYKRILFIDFDGTITTEETLSKAMEMCISPELFKEGMTKIQSGEWTLRETVRFAFDNIPGSCMDTIMEYVRTVPIRNGFEKLLLGMKDMGIPVVIISGGLKPYVEEKLAPYKDLILDIHSLDINPTETSIELISPYEGETDVIEKTEVMKHYDYESAICVGDGLTDIRMALSCDKVFARDVLAQVLSEKNVAFTPWEDFDDVYAGIVSEVE